MTTKERTPERRREDAAVEVGEKAAPPPAIAPAVPAWLAFLSAGICGSAAGYLLMTVDTFRSTYDTLGFELPWITRVVMQAPLLLPAGLVVTGAGLLGLGAWRRPLTRAWEAVGELSRVGALLAGGAGCAFITANALVFQTLSKALQH
jgi:hypothetical protein